MKYFIFGLLIIIAFSVIVTVMQMRDEEQSMIKTDFSEITELYLIYPESIKEDDCNYNELTDFYNELIELIPEEIELSIFVKTEQIGEKIKDLRINLKYIVNNDLNSIWLRDFAGFNFNDKIVKPIFKPKYSYSKTANIINKSMKTLNSFLNKELTNIPLKWDGGNLVTNGKIGFITERIIRDNQKKFSEIQIEEIIKENLNINPIFIPVLKDDEIAHSDGYLAFLDRETILLSEYPDDIDFAKDNEYVSQIKKILINNNFKPTRIQENPIGENIIKDIQSAKGIYINFLRLNNTIILPFYKFEKADDNEYNEINKKTLTDLGFDVIIINCDELAKFGGVLHCISFTN